MTHRVRVLRLIARMNVGGPAWQVATLTRRLDPARFHTLLVTGSVEADEADYLELREPDLPVTRMEGLGRSIRTGGDARALAALVGLMRRYRPDVVHTHTAKAGSLGRLAAWVAGVPVTVHTFHGHLLRGYFSRPVTAAVRTAERLLATRTTRLVAVGEQVRDELLAAGIGRRHQYAVIPPGVALPVAPDRSAARQLLGLPECGPVVLYVARLTAVKRPDRFVDVATELAGVYPDTTFAVAGEGSLLEDTRARATPLGSRIRFLGWRKDIETLYAAADVVVLTSDNEGMPVSLIEASLAGRPCVTTAVGGAAEVVLDGETGLVVGRDVRHLAAAVGRLLSDPVLRATFGAAATLHAQHRFGVDRLVNDVEALYEEILSSPGAVSRP